MRSTLSLGLLRCKFRIRPTSPPLRPTGSIVQKRLHCLRLSEMMAHMERYPCLPVIAPSGCSSPQTVAVKEEEEVDSSEDEYDGARDECNYYRVEGDGDGDEHEHLCKEELENSGGWDDDVPCPE